ncbi:hypothetical protein M407DRAFT_23618 [Tulasnella calospora MUT 4182]|uniref:HTH APSES-type domain-containing protein n=1 Tax=Tulasnella calospora MUT 4182 TaxID=1051891 RepID=A0A0C3QJ71_9AGAM|nr:hypothetical protein M407DRAFT_23618 [Tulasnella calospora MUT 4182]
MAPRNKGKDAAGEPQIFKATYSGVPVYEMVVKGVAVMRRRSDGWLNATQILKVAGFDKPQRTRVLEREVQKGEHEKVQGGYGKYQGTWVPLERGLSLAKQYNIGHFIQPIVDFSPQSSSPPLAPRHLPPAPVKPKKKTNVTGEGGSIATRSAKRGDQASGPATMAVGDDDGEADAIGEDDDFSEMVGEGGSRESSPQASEDGSMTSSPSGASSSSRTPSPFDAPADGPSGGNGAIKPQNAMDWSATSRASASSIQATGSGVKSGTGQAYSQTGPYASAQATFGFQQPFQLSFQQPFQMGRVPDNQTTYGDIILEYFISDTTTIPQILIAPPPDFDPNMSIDDDGHTALHWACAMGRVRVVKLLLTAGADIFRTNKGGQTPLMRSVMFANNYDVRKFPELYELLHRSTLNIDNYNRTVFHHIVDLAMSKGKTHAARYYMETLLNRLSDFPRELADIINFQDEDGETALTLAARCRSKRLVKLLLDHGADPKIRNADQKTTEDYILEDERFRYSPHMRGQALALPGPSGVPGAYGPRLHNSSAAQHAAGKCTQDMAVLLDNLAASFDQELADKDRDLVQARALLANIQAEIVETQKAVDMLNQQAAELDGQGSRLHLLEGELKAKMGKRFRLGWEKWLKDEEAREKTWKSTGGGTILVQELLNRGAGGTVSAGTGEPTTLSPERKTRAAVAGLGQHNPEEVADLVDLYTEAAKVAGGGSTELAQACDTLRREIEQHRTKRRQGFEDYVQLSAESGTGGRMVDYRRLIGAGCGGVPPYEVDNVIGVLLETLEADEGSLTNNAPKAAVVVAEV